MFSFYNISYKLGHLNNSILVSGELQNSSTKSYSYALFRIFLFDKHRKIIGSGIIKLADFKNSSTRQFEVLVEDVSYVTLKGITSCDIILDSGY